MSRYQHYTVEDVLSGVIAQSDWQENGADDRTSVEAVIAAVAPAIAARALRVASEDLIPTLTIHGVRVADAFLTRADEIERGVS